MNVQEAIEHLRRMPASAEVVALVVAATEETDDIKANEGYEYVPTFH